MKRKLLIFFIIFALVLPPISLINHSQVQAQTYNEFKWINISQIEVTAYILNVRTGPGTTFPVIGKVRRGQRLNVMGALGSWYVIHLSNNSVGVISSKWTRVVKYINQPKQTTPKPTPKPNPTPTPGTTGLTADEKQMFSLVNAERTKQGLPALKINMELVNTARAKAKDMADKNYFSHYSPTYGSPFDMMKKFGITYQAAAENIAGNSTVQRAHNALMNSPGHRANIMSSRYTDIGIGIVPDEKYGKIFVQMFIKK